jgi:hypothetical protein
MNGSSAKPTRAPGAHSWSCSNNPRTRHQPFSTTRKTGTNTSAPGFTRARSWTASWTTPSGSRPTAIACKNTPPARSSHKGSRGRAPVAPDCATARHREAIPAAPEGNIQRPPNPQILSQLAGEVPIPWAYRVSAGVPRARHLSLPELGRRHSL